MKQAIKVLILTVSLFAIAGCALFKDSCDCPEFGQKIDEHQRTGPYEAHGTFVTYQTGGQPGVANFLNQPDHTNALLPTISCETAPPLIKN